MKNNSIAGVWFRQIRGPFLVLSIVLVFIGIAGAYRDGFIHWGQYLLLTAGVILAHISVNLFNELSDFKAGIDENTIRTPFSGGSGMLQSGKTSVKSVTAVAYTALLVSASIGFYFYLTSGWLILIFMITGGVAIRFYTSHLTKWRIGEAVSGLTLGSFVVLGVYYALAEKLTTEIVLISIPPGILTALLLFLNEFPDLEADRKGGRNHLVIFFGREKSSRIYIASLVAMYLWILLMPLISGVPWLILISLFTLPMALKAGYRVYHQYDHVEKLIPALGMNVGVVILTDLLLAIGLLF